jgi:hypothetical protein
MLADYLLARKEELVQKVELRAAEDEGPGAAKGRHRRVAELVEELIETLRGGAGAPAHRADAARGGALQCHERSLIQEETLSDVIKESLAVPPSEMVAVSDWASASNRAVSKSASAACRICSTTCTKAQP